MVPAFGLTENCLQNCTPSSMSLRSSGDTGSREMRAAMRSKSGSSAESSCNTTAHRQPGVSRSPAKFTLSNSALFTKI